ncbi:hypothetical protein BDV96DRAFT_661970 [Lophiotrema nucula]|uniref:Uncharacterized protein n=1 Tax=Lophiotrema nucula TaxID=690887 RepID=A0A6A5Z498_9PLEO|nr:hypothetical protein BDV96DRAFT_661970 [Lophiotrema nucula]
MTTIDDDFVGIYRTYPEAQHTALSYSFLEADYDQATTEHGTDSYSLPKLPVASSPSQRAMELRCYDWSHMPGFEFYQAPLPSMSQIDERLPDSDTSSWSSSAPNVREQQCRYERVERVDTVIQASTPLEVDTIETQSEPYLKDMNDWLLEGRRSQQPVADYYDPTLVYTDSIAQNTSSSLLQSIPCTYVKQDAAPKETSEIARHSLADRTGLRYPAQLNDNGIQISLRSIRRYYNAGTTVVTGANSQEKTASIDTGENSGIQDIAAIDAINGDGGAWAGYIN